ncbi:MAG: hypothetical protein FJ299_11595 [Planctomycetes bacterium]|nr:hypothetical protein [Planctomycetota bacterium]
MPSTPNALDLLGAVLLTIGLSNGSALCAAASAPAQSPAEYAAAHDAKLGAARRDAEAVTRELELGWKYLLTDEKREVAEYFTAQAGTLDSYQRRLISRARQLSDRDPSLWPVEAELAWYDPKKHAPKQPIPRKRLAEDDPLVSAARTALAAPLPRAIAATWSYDWGTRGLQRSSRRAEDDPERIFANACLGLPPDADWALALVLRALDDGAQSTALAAFAHAYTDREGGVYPFTLYEAWSAGREMEMPDVDTLGLLHDLTNDWKTFVAPVPQKQHAKLYEGTLFPLFVPARAHRAPREGLAQTYLRAEPGLSEGYEAAVIRFHALWDYMNELPPKLAGALSENRNWDKYFKQWTASLAKQQVLYERGHVRQLRLLDDELALRQLLLSCMRELGVLGRTALPKAAGTDGH